MTTRELAQKVIVLRVAQRKYFRTRAQGDLNESKRLEAELDKTCAELVQQPGLFDRIEDHP